MCAVHGAQPKPSVSGVEEPLRESLPVVSSSPGLKTHRSLITLLSPSDPRTDPPPPPPHPVLWLLDPMSQERENGCLCARGPHPTMPSPQHQKLESQWSHLLQGDESSPHTPPKNKIWIRKSSGIGPFSFGQCLLKPRLQNQGKKKKGSTDPPPGLALLWLRCSGMSLLLYLIKFPTVGTQTRSPGEL